MAVLRAFIGLALEEPVLGAAARCLDSLRSDPIGRDLRFVRSEGLHVTLRFLGAIDSEALASLAAAVAAHVRPLSPFAAQLGALHVFPSAERPRVIALGLDPAAQLSELAQAVERGVQEAGFAPEPRAFRSHVTLARVREGRRPSLAGAPLPEPARFTVREATLFESRPGPGGSIYVPRARMALEGTAPAQPRGPDS